LRDEIGHDSYRHEIEVEIRFLQSTGQKNCNWIRDEVAASIKISQPRDIVGPIDCEPCIACLSQWRPNRESQPSEAIR
jgi:hypothetical protein